MTGSDDRGRNGVFREWGKGEKEERRGKRTDKT